MLEESVSLSNPHESGKSTGADSGRLVYAGAAPPSDQTSGEREGAIIELYVSTQCIAAVLTAGGSCFRSAVSQFNFDRVVR